MPSTPTEKASPWTALDIPDLRGTTAIVTGASSGLGFVAARELAAHGARVTLAVRDGVKGDARAAEIRALDPSAQVDVRVVDLASLASIRDFASAFKQDSHRLDILLNNAGIMAVPRRETTTDGFELQFGTNHLGHFALTGLLMPLLSATSGARIVTVSSNLHKRGTMNFDDLNAEKSYRPWTAYAQSKLANLLFTSELQRRLETARIDAIAVAAHPGWSNTPLMESGPMRGRGRFMRWLGRSTNNLMAQSIDMGALPELYAATAPGVWGNEYIGPDGKAEQSGYPRKTTRTQAAASDEDARRLWEISEKLTGVSYLPASLN